MRYLLSFHFALFALVLTAQAGNPFELTDRLPAAGADTTVATTAATGNPFDLIAAAAPARETSRPARRANGRSATPQSGISSGRRGPLIIQPVDPNQGRGSLLAIQMILLLALAGIWLLFGDTLRECLRGTLNDNLLSNLYTRRSGGGLTALWVSYVFFFFAAGFNFYLLARYYNVGTGQGVWGGWLTFSLVVAAALGLKNMVLTFFASVYPVQKEVSRYLFAVMVFSILAGLFIAPLNLLASYAPEAYRFFFLHAGVVVLVGVYLLHLLRGVFIANKLLATRPVHILLYICAIEIAPILLIYRYLSDTLA